MNVKAVKSLVRRTKKYVSLLNLNKCNFFFQKKKLKKMKEKNNIYILKLICISVMGSS